MLNWQCGDSFDYSILLCSLLLGAGYDAYVVVGYATSKLTQKMESKTPMPTEEIVKVEEKPAEVVDIGRYQLSPAPSLESKFLLMQRTFNNNVQPLKVDQKNEKRN